MIDTLQEYSDLVHVLVAFGTLLVWLFYAQLLLSNYRRQLRPRILINQGVGTGLRSRCMISNMGKEPIYVDTLFATLHTDTGDYTAQVTDRDQPDGEQPPLSIQQGSSQGPLQSGDSHDTGTFEDILIRVANLRHLPRTDNGMLDMGQVKVHSLEMQVAAIHGPDDLPVGATRRFRMRHFGDQYALIPVGPRTKQMMSRRERQEVYSWFQQTTAHE